MGAPLPGVSILLPAWNAEATLGAALRSITRQTLPDWECVIVDDGSTDATLAIAAAAARVDARFRVLSRPHAGLVGALNNGLQYCRHDTIARMDADDVMHRERLSVQVDALTLDPGLAAVGGHVRIFPRRVMSHGLRVYERWINSLASPEDVAREAFIESPVVHPTLMMRRSMADLGYRDPGWPEDYDLVLRALDAGMHIGVVPRRVLGWRDSAGSLSRSDPRYSLAAITRCKAHYLAAGFLHDRADYILWGYGGTGRALRRALVDVGRVPSHIVEVKPTRLGNRIHGAPVIPPDALCALRGSPIVVSVAREGPRSQIREALAAMAFTEGRDFVCAA